MRGLEQSIPAAETEPRRWLEIARRSLARADELLLSLPLLVARERVARETISLDEILAIARADVDQELGLAEGRLTVHGPLGAVEADPDRLRIALRNLLRNGIQHRRPRVPLDMTVRSWRRGPRLTLTLSDNGAGLPPGERARLRGPLRPGRSVTGGLGLAIARAAIEASGGALAATSRAGLGTTFAITLPIAEATPRAIASPEAGASPKAVTAPEAVPSSESGAAPERIASRKAIPAPKAGAAPASRSRERVKRRGAPPPTRP